MATKRRALAPRRAPRSKRARPSEFSAFKKRVSRVLESIEDRLDSLESEASLADGTPIPAEKVWKDLGL